MNPVEIQNQILVATDNALTQMLLGEMIGSTHPSFKIISCNTRGKVFATLGACHPSLVFIDNKLIDVVGVALALQIKRHPDFRYIPMVFVSATLSGVDLAEYGFKAFLKKPFRLQAIESVIEQCVSGVKNRKNKSML